eukprot:EC787427.1.p1 GENE.EC787427.1~~EC787427.1.p1  ORF type:complete len:142 (+),score=49.29 EC787427.1:31-456(+)
MAFNGDTRQRAYPRLDGYTSRDSGFIEEATYNKRGRGGALIGSWYEERRAQEENERLGVTSHAEVFQKTATFKDEQDAAAVNVQVRKPRAAFEIRKDGSGQAIPFVRDDVVCSENRARKNMESVVYLVERRDVQLLILSSS